MKQSMMNTAAGVLAAVLLGSAGLAYANPYPVGSQQWHNFNGIMQSEADRIQRERNAVRQQPTYSGPTAAEIRAWEQREAEVQAEIARFRATPYWMVIGRDWEKSGFIWSGGYESKQRAVEETLKQCRSSNCGVVAAFSNACGVIVYAVHHPKTINDIFVGVDADDRKAAEEAMRACEAVHGKREDRCFYSGIRTRNGTAFCSGYDYGIYNQK
ncbi:DUF4189 domain-containing protein [Eikenella exigua]|uniref:DUF4189 domain-containing protein n=1 Tax=Eikenella exigua TaxID=2528037 RepID=A0AAX1F6G3_9NEIS|nr:DUF4189 domain-containing protein [Eikenella exigua]QED91610.1 DUF4189 domain-containing protein [Eikenella exigua]